MDRATPICVSLIIPVYNGEAYLRECLDSVLVPAPSCAVEIICVDDGSTDGSAALLAEYARQHSCVTVISKPNGGLSSARNAGLRQARGEYVQFLDCDDRLAAGALDKLYSQAHEQQLDVLYFDGETFYDNDQYQHSHSRYETIYRTKVPVRGVRSGEEMFVTLSEGRSYRASACLQMIRHAYLEGLALTFIEGILFEDNPFTLHAMLHARRTALCNVPLYQRRMRDGSIVTSKKTPAHVRSHLICYREMKALAERGQYGPEVTRNIAIQLSSMLQEARSDYATLTDEEKRQIADHPDGAWMQPLLDSPADSPRTSPLRDWYGRLLDQRWFFVLTKPLRNLLHAIRQKNSGK